MIDIKKAEEEFKNYTSKYNMNESHLYRKVTHTFRVEKICEEIAISLGLNEEEINLAKLIGILHDIARFEQYTIYNTFVDHKSIDHGNLGVEILEKDEHIRKYLETNEYDEIIKKAIYNHNKYSIETNLNEKEELFSKIIRDADKLDIMYQGTCEFWKDNIEDIKKQTISPKVFEQFISEQIIDKRYVQNDLDKVLVNIAFVFDYNFKENYKILKRNNYINKTLNRFNFEKEETKEKMELIRKIANNYIKNKIEN